MNELEDRPRSEVNINVSTLAEIMGEEGIRECISKALRLKKFKEANEVWKETGVSMRWGDLYAAFEDMTLWEDERDSAVKILDEGRIEPIKESQVGFLLFEGGGRLAWLRTIVRKRVGKEVVGAYAKKSYINWLDDRLKNFLFAQKYTKHMTEGQLWDATYERIESSFERLKNTIPSELYTGQEKASQKVWVKSVLPVLFEKWEKRKGDEWWSMHEGIEKLMRRWEQEQLKGTAELDQPRYRKAL